VEGSRLDEVIEFFNYIVLSATTDPGDYSTSNRNEYRKQKKMFLGNRARLVLKIDNLTTMCVPTVQAMWDPQHLTAL
jgi:hypothetical protein